MTTINTATQATRELSNDELDAELATDLPKREEMSSFHRFFHNFHHDFCRHEYCYEPSYCYEPCYESYSRPDHHHRHQRDHCHPGRWLAGAPLARRQGAEHVPA